MTQQVIGFIGMGLMGVPMSQRLLAAGYSVVVWNRSPDKCQPVLEQGAVHAANLHELLHSVDIVMSCVSDSDAVRDLVQGAGGMAECQQPRAGLLIDFSSIAPDVTRELAAYLGAANAMQWVDAPVSGGVAGAEAGSLAIMAGGSVENIESIRPILAHLGQRLTHMGDIGCGQVSKVCNQMIVSCNVLVMAEALALAAKQGVDVANIPQALKGGFADSIPLQLTGGRMARGEFDEVKWHVKTLLKDLNMARDVASDCGAIPMSELARQLMDDSARQGMAALDPANLIRRYLEHD